MRISPNRLRCQSDGSTGPQLFPVLSEKNHVASQTAVFLLHCQPVATIVLVKKVRSKGFKELILAKPENGIFDAHEIIEHLKQSSMDKPAIFILEANYGNPGSDIPNHQLIQDILDNIKPIYFILYSATEQCLKAAEEVYKDRIFTLWAGGGSLDSIFSRISNISPPELEKKDKPVSLC